MRLARLAAVPKNRAVKLLRRYFAPAQLAEGRLKGSEQDIRFFYAGEANFRAYLYGLMFYGPPRIVRSWQAYLPRLRGVIGKTSFDLGIALIPNRYEASLRGVYSYRGTKNVRQETGVSAPWDEMARCWRNKEQTARKIRKFGLQPRVSHQPEDFDLFYHQMFLPHVRHQFGNRAYIDSYEEMKPWFDQGFMLLVMEGETPIAGGLCSIAGDTLVFHRTGVLHGDLEHAKKGAQAAMYYFMLSHAKEKNLKKVNLLLSHAFVHDGVYHHKAGWGAGASPDDKAAQCLLYFLASGNAKTVLFLEKNPALVAGDNGTLDVLTGWSGSAEEFAAAKDAILRACAAPGIKRLIVHSEEGVQTVDLPPS